jgi:hypothetical protein
VSFSPSRENGQMAAKGIRDLVRRLTQQRTDQEMSAAESEMAEHVVERQALRQQMQEDAAADEQARNEHEAARQALQEFGERYTYQQRNEVREVVQEGMRLAAAVNRPLVLARYSPGGSPRDRLVRGCRDLNLRQQWAAAVAALERATEAERAAGQAVGQAMSKAADARRERVEIMGRIRQQFGAEGGRWRRVEQADQVTVEAVMGADGKPLIHESNIQFLNGNLCRPNRVIREAAAVMAAENGESLSQALQAAREALGRVEARMIESEM